MEKREQIIKQIKTIIKEVCGSDYTDLKIAPLKMNRYDIFIKHPEGIEELGVFMIDEMEKRFDYLGINCKIYDYQTMKKMVY